MSSIFEETNNFTITLKETNEQINKPMNILKNSELNTHKNSILSLLTNKNKRRSSNKTADSNIYIPLSFDYDFNEIKRFDELNKSLSDISDFDLEKDDDEDKSDFNSSEDESDFDEEEILNKEKTINNIKKYDSEYEKELEKEYEEIENELNKRKCL